MTAEQFTLNTLKTLIVLIVIYTGFTLGRLIKDNQEPQSEAGDYNIYLGEQIYIVDPETKDTILIDTFESGSELSKAILKDNE